MGGGMEVGAAILLCLLGGLCAADTRAAGGRGFHFPLVAGVLAGWIARDPAAGLVCGAWFQLVWILPMPVGGTILPDASTAAIAAVIMRATLAPVTGEALALPLALALGTALAAASVPAERVARRWNARKEASIAAGRPVPASAVCVGLAGPFLRGLLSVALAIAAGGALRETGPLAGPWVHLRAPVIPALLAGAAAVAATQLLVRARLEAGRAMWAWFLAAALAGAASRLVWSTLRP